METSQPVDPAQMESISSKDKDPKRQAAGRKGAEACKKKLEALEADLAIAKEKIYGLHAEAKNPTEPEPSHNIVGQSSLLVRSSVTDPWSGSLALPSPFWQVFISTRPKLKLLHHVRKILLHSSAALPP